MGLKFNFEDIKKTLYAISGPFFKIRSELRLLGICTHVSKAYSELEVGHREIVKNYIPFSSLRSTLPKSCVHSMNASYQEQVKQLKEAGFPTSVLVQACNKLVRMIKVCEKLCAQKEVDQQKMFAVFLYIHRTNDRLKKVGSRYGVQVAILARCKLGKACAIVDRKERDINSAGSNQCTLNHKEQVYPV